jgi:hypothetical protein
MFFREKEKLIQKVFCSLSKSISAGKKSFSSVELGFFNLIMIVLGRFQIFIF